MTPLDLVVRATIHDGPGRALHALLVDVLASIGTPSDAEVTDALARFEAEADIWGLWRVFDKARLRCLQRGIADARRYDVAFEYSPAPAGAVTWRATREMAKTRAKFRPWDRANVLEHLRSLASRFQEIGAARVQLFGSVARDEWRESSDIDLMVFVPPDRRRDIFGIAESVGEECRRFFGYDWQAQSGESYKKEFLDHIACEAIEVLT